MPIYAKNFFVVPPLFTFLNTSLGLGHHVYRVNHMIMYSSKQKQTNEHRPRYVLVFANNLERYIIVRRKETNKSHQHYLYGFVGNFVLILSLQNTYGTCVCTRNLSSVQMTDEFSNYNRHSKHVYLPQFLFENHVAIVPYFTHFFFSPQVGRTTYIKLHTLPSNKTFTIII